MLNLVQIQDKLRDLPTQAIMSYANGQNPMVPPYLALGELNRRKQMEQSATAEQARSQGEPPTVKQATEQQLGLMNLQRGRAMQAQQNMGQAMASAQAPVPAGVGEEPVQMAAGGLTRLPSNIRGYAGGGIVAFAGNEDQPVNEDMPSNYIDPELDRKKRQAAMWERVKSSNKPYLAEDFREDAAKILNPLISFLTMKESRDLEKAKKLQTADQPGDYPTYTPRPPKDKAEEVVEKVTEKVIEKPKVKSGIETVAPQKPVTPTAGLDNIAKYEKMLKDRNLDVMPETNKGIEALRQVSESYKKEPYADWTEGLLGSVQDIRSGQAIGSSRAKQQKENQAKLNEMNLKIAEAEDLKTKARFEFDRGNFDKAVAYDKESQKLVNEAKIANAQLINANKSPAEIQMIERIAKEKGISFTEAIQQLNLEKGLAARLKDAQSKWETEPLLKMQWEKKGGYDAYLRSLGLPPQSGNSPVGGVNSALISKADQIISGK
jgi:hypothetical protein